MFLKVAFNLLGKVSLSCPVSFAQKYQAFKFPLSSKLRRLAESSAESISEVFWNIKQLICLSSCCTEFQNKPRDYSGDFLTINLTSSDFSYYLLNHWCLKKPHVVCRIHGEWRNNMPAINNYNCWIIFDKRNYARVQDASLCTFRSNNRSFSEGRYVAKLKLLPEKSRITPLKRMTIFLS